jgi:hypothetical protein
MATPTESPLLTFPQQTVGGLVAGRAVRKHFCWAKKPAKKVFKNLAQEKGKESNN